MWQKFHFDGLILFDNFEDSCALDLSGFGALHKAFAQEYGIQVLNSSSYYAQAESTNKIIEKMPLITNKPASWDYFTF